MPPPPGTASSSSVSQNPSKEPCSHLGPPNSTFQNPWAHVITGNHPVWAAGSSVCCWSPCENVSSKGIPGLGDKQWGIRTESLPERECTGDTSGLAGWVFEQSTPSGRGLMGMQGDVWNQGSTGSDPRIQSQLPQWCQPPPSLCRVHPRVSGTCACIVNAAGAAVRRGRSTMKVLEPEKTAPSPLPHWGKLL